VIRALRNLILVLGGAGVLLACSPSSVSVNDSASHDSTPIVATTFVASSPPISGTNGTIVRVVDGDTVIASFAGHDERIRLIGINTPETVHPTKPVECWGPEASHHTKEILPAGTPITIQRDVEPRDKYGRLLAYVWRTSDGLFVNLELVADGYARPYPFEPNTSREQEFATAANNAQSQHLGLWGHCL